MRLIGVGRRNRRCASSEPLARAVPRSETSGRDGLDPQACRAGRPGPRTMAAPWRALARIHDHELSRRDELPSRNRKPAPARNRAHRAA